MIYSHAFTIVCVDALPPPPVPMSEKANTATKKKNHAAAAPPPPPPAAPAAATAATAAAAVGVILLHDLYELRTQEIKHSPAPWRTCFSATCMERRSCKFTNIVRDYTFAPLAFTGCLWPCGVERKETIVHLHGTVFSTHVTANAACAKTGGISPSFM